MKYYLKKFWEGYGKYQWEVIEAMLFWAFLLLIAAIIGGTL